MMIRGEKKQQERLRVVRDFLESESTLLLSVRDRDGAVHSAPLFYLPIEDLTLAWLSSTNSIHSKCLVNEPRAAASVFRSTFNWQQIVGVQMEGVAEQIDDHQQSSLLGAYSTRFQLNSVLALAAATSTFYCFRPQWIRFIDNRVRFGYKFEIRIYGETRVTVSC